MAHSILALEGVLEEARRIIAWRRSKKSDVKALMTLCAKLESAVNKVDRIEKLKAKSR